MFGGRLGTYKYYDMHNVIDTALTGLRGPSRTAAEEVDRRFARGLTIEP